MSKWEIVVHGFESYSVINSETGKVVMNDIVFFSIADHLLFQLESGQIEESKVVQPLKKHEINWS